MRQRIKSASRIGGRNWFIIVLLGLAGQIAWCVENSWFNTFVYDTITPDPKPIAWMVAISAITATVTTLVMGTLSDRAGKRKPFILYGYILWGISTVIFPMSAFIKATSLAILLVIAADALMTFFGSTAYDSAFNAWTTDISDRTNRGSLSSVIAVLPFLAAVVSAGLSGIVIDSLGYYTFFYTLGIAVSIMGLVGGLLLKDSPKLRKASRSETSGFFSQLFSVFKPENIRQNRELFLVMSAIGLFSIGVQVFLPYLMIYVNNYLKIDKSAAGLIMAIAIFASTLLAIPAGKLADRGHVKKLALAAPFVMLAGLLLFSVSRSFYQVAATAVVLYFGIILLTLSTSAWIKNLMPEESRGQFEGVRMIFNVAIPMIIGPAIGSALITHFGIATVSNGEAGFIPTPVIFQVAGVLSLTCVIPILMIIKSKPRGHQAPPDLGQDCAIPREQKKTTIKETRNYDA